MIITSRVNINDIFERNDYSTEYISRFANDRNFHLFINCVCQLYFALSYLESSAVEFIWSFSQMFNEVSFGYPKGGGGAIPGSFLSGLEKYGGKIKFGETVQSLKYKMALQRVLRLINIFIPLIS